MCTVNDESSEKSQAIWTLAKQSNNERKRKLKCVGNGRKKLFTLCVFVWGGGCVGGNISGSQASGSSGTLFQGIEHV